MVSWNMKQTFNCRAVALAIYELQIGGHRVVCESNGRVAKDVVSA